MDAACSRRVFLAATPSLALTPALLANDDCPPNAGIAGVPGPVPSYFPSQDPADARAIVGASHGNMERVRELLESQPELAKAMWDWGFGDWETALGAASHTGNREIALLLIEHGARINIFAAAMLGYTDVVRSFIEAQPGIQRTPGPHGIPLLAHARAGREHAADTLEYLRSVEGANEGAASPALSGEERAVYVGSYRYAEPDGVLTVGYSDRFEMLTIRGPGESASFRSLVNRGDHVFTPGGAPNARIRFTVEGNRATSLAITTPAPLLTAARVG